MGRPAEDVQAPAIALMTVGAVDVAVALGDIAMAVTGIGIAERQQLESLFGGWLVGSTFAFLVLRTLVVVLGSGFVMYGGWQMLKLRDHTQCMVASVIAMLPCLTPWCCCLLGVPIGIWSLLVLNRADVRNAFGATGS